MVFKKIAALFLGMILSLVILEAGLNLGGFIQSSRQESKNLRSVKQKGAYRILCLGESTTAGQYPSFLEQVLNQRNIGVRFSVIDKGMVCVSTPAILSRVESYLAEYHPDMVVAMMGINDKSVKYYGDIPESDTWLFRHCRTYRFGRILYMHFLNKLRKKDIYASDITEFGGTTQPEDAGTISEKENLSNKTSAEKLAQLDFKGAERADGPISSYLKDGKISQTEASLKEAILRDPENEKVYAELTKLYQLQSKAFHAEDFFKKAIELDPKNANAYVGLGRFYLLQKKSLQAEDSFKKAIELDPENTNAYVGLGYFFQERGEISQAEDFFKKAIEINPRNDKAYAGLGGLYRGQGKFQEAEDSFKKAIEINPEYAKAYAGLSQLCRIQGKSFQAEDSFKKTIELNPKNDRAYVALGELYMKRNKFSQAADSYRKAIEINPENDYAYVGLGRLYRDHKKFSQTEAFYKKAIEINPANANAYAELGGVYRYQGKFVLAKESCERAIEHDPANARAFYELGWLYRDQGELSQAKNIFTKGIELNPRDERLLRAMVLLYEEMGKPELAKGYVEKARSENYVAVTVSNHRKLKEILDRKGIKLVCVQYPVRNVDPLKSIFENDKGVIFVDNERVFKEAVKRSGYKEYFRDMFGGDFGHCTQKGNELLAQNIADVILKEVFNK